MPKSKFFPIFKLFQDEEYKLCVTSEILMEYEEILTNHIGEELTSLILQIIENAPNTIFVNRYFHWNLINEDPDDNKFVDCAVASNAKYLVSQDKHFNVLREIEFPKIEIIQADKFMHNLLSKNRDDL